MKTVIDAVNEFEGELKRDTRLIIRDGRGTYESCLHQIVNDFYKLVCTRDQFNDLVSQMETNFGKCSPSYEEYKKTWNLVQEHNKPETLEECESRTKSDKELEVMDIWKNAPEGATHYGTSGNFFKETDGKFAIFTCGLLYGGWLVDNQAQPSRINLTPKPVQPVFTRSMADNGELPVVGMDCMIHHECAAKDSWVKVYIVAVTEDYIISKSNGSAFEQHYHIKSLSFKPIDTRTDKEKAIDDH